jgi:hypothetical protein
VRLAILAAALIAAAFVMPATPAHAQAHRGPDLVAQQAAMDRIAGMIGDWEGEANVTLPAPRIVYQREHIERDMDGLLLLIHGHGYADATRSGTPIFRAVGVISYDDARQIYEFRVYNDGRAATATARFLDDGRLQWTMDFSPVIVRYTITLGANTWNEVGEMSRDSGATWAQTIEMNLTRVQ